MGFPKTPLIQNNKRTIFSKKQLNAIKSNAAAAIDPRIEESKDACEFSYIKLRKQGVKIFNFGSGPG